MVCNIVCKARCDLCILSRNAVRSSLCSFQFTIALVFHMRLRCFSVPLIFSAMMLIAVRVILQSDIATSHCCHRVSPTEAKSNAWHLSRVSWTVLRQVVRRSSSPHRSSTRTSIFLIECLSPRSVFVTYFWIRRILTDCTIELKTVHVAYGNGYLDQR